MPTPSTHGSIPQPAFLFGPWLDAWLLGGGSLAALLLLQALHLSGSEVAVLGIAMLILANFVNHPHFAHSYQLFYGSWQDLKDGQLAPALARRWWWAGVAAPLVLALALLAGALLWLHGYGLVLAVLLLLMGTLVGWHYVKQGFGMAMTDAALKRCFWPADTRKALLANAYACWGAAWVLLNASSVGRSFWGVMQLDIRLPDGVVLLPCLLAVMTTLWAAVQVSRAIQAWRTQGRDWKQMPLAGLLAYVTTLYCWTVFAGLNPAFVLVIPFFHSLQYLTVVWRYKLNETSAQAPQLRRRQLMDFLLRGLALGGTGFWLLPGAVDYVRAGQLPIWSSGVALVVACAWIFINVHHYLIDSVLWRQGNPKVSQHLFGARSAPFQASPLHQTATRSGTTLAQEEL